MRARRRSLGETAALGGRADGGATDQDLRDGLRAAWVEVARSPRRHSSTISALNSGVNHRFNRPPQCRFLLGMIRSVWVSHVQSVHLDGLRVDITGLRAAFLYEAEERTQRASAQVQRVKGQGIGLFPRGGAGGDAGRAASGPVGQLEGERCADVLDDATVGLRCDAGAAG